MRLAALVGRDAKDDAAAKTGEMEPVDGEQPAGVGREVADSLEVMLPWVSSLLIHLGIVVLTLFVVWSVTQTKDLMDDTPILVSARLSDRPGGSTLAQSSDFDLQATQSNVRHYGPRRPA